MDTFGDGVQQVSTKYLAGLSDSRTYPRWAQDIGLHVVPAFYQRLQKKSALFPQVNRNKSVGRETAFRYTQFRPKEPRDVTTLDLQLLEYHDGIQIEGPCEVRRHFKFNDIKPRIYFAQGGTAFFKSRYMKYVAVEAMETLSATRERSRDDPIYFLNMYSSWDEELVLNWDLSSFTSTLGELRHFLHYFTRSLERRFGRAWITIFDWKEGSKRASLVDLLDEYNRSMNFNPEFSLLRMMGCIENHCPGTVLSSRNGGLLGVPGNIGFSTFLHGLVAERAVGDGNAVCVGDDAIAIGTRTSVEILKQDIQRIGVIQVEKFAETQVNSDTKFLKRRVSLTPNGLTIDKLLFSIPIAYDILRIEPKGRTVARVNEYQAAKRMCQIFGSQLWSFQSFAWEITDQDIQEMSQIMKAFYAVYNLPRGGGFPGFMIHFEGRQIRGDFVVPPIPFRTYDPRVVDWAEYLVEQRKTRYVHVPKKVPDTIRIHELELVGGNVITCTQSEFVNYLEDIGAASVEKVTELIDMEVELNRRKFIRWLKKVSGKQLLEVTMLKTIDHRLNLEGICTTVVTGVSKLSMYTLE